LTNPFLGEIRLFGWNWAPQGWHLCDGSLLAISSNTALFSLLGTYYGGNGTSTFGLPDLRGRVPIHFGPTYQQGEMDGAENVSLLTGQMPLHSHTFQGINIPGTVTQPIGNALANVATTTDPKYAADSGPPQPMNPTAVSVAGGNVPHPNMQPYLVLNYSIATAGRFPTRN
jgi:microcystin-dependent protein